jgi:F0F1-type ATP synthase membrane subunit b/b'
VIRMIGWDSVETTARLHSFFEFWGIVLFLVVVAFEFAAYFYGHRHDFLVDDRDRLAGIARDKADKTKDAEAKRLSDALAAAQTGLQQAQQDAAAARQQASTAQQDAAQAKASTAQRVLSNAQKQALVASLSQFGGQKVTIASVMGDGDGDRYKRDFLEVLRAAKWNFNEGTDVSQAVIMPTPSGVQVTINQEDAKNGNVLKSAYEFMHALHKLGITKHETMFVNPQVPSGVVNLIIGTK